jgi:predicted O-methyltransferase YrrM
MYNWTNDIPNNTKKDFLNIIEYFNFKNKNNNEKVQILEIGAYTGISLINIVKLIPNSIGYGLDKWSNYNELNNVMYINELEIEKSFYSNIIKEKLDNRIFGIKSNSTSKLIDFIKNDIKFDFIYIDGSHLLLECYSDLTLSWQILKNGGILVIDDFLFEMDSILNSPFEAVNYFLKLYESNYKILLANYRIFLEKI